MSKGLGRLRKFVLAGASALAIGSILAGLPVSAKDFTFDEKSNAEIAKRLKIPVYFTVPSASRAKLPSIETTDRLVDFKHPDGMKAQGELGLRVAVTKRAGMAARLAKSGLIQTGDILLTVRPEWGGAGAYPNIQMGISHTGLAYIKDGAVRNIDNPLDQEYLGPGFRADLNSGHYNTLNMLHIIRPRNLTETQKANILAWASRMNSNATRIYPGKLSFNTDYNAPKYKSGEPYTFVKHLGQASLLQNPNGNVGMFCSEFVWSLLALRDCDPAKTADEFKGSDVPSCVLPVMQPMSVTGDFVGRKWRSSNAGLADGPLIAVDALKLPEADREKLIHSIFVDNPAGLSRMSPGHRKVATDMKPKFAPLEKYYIGALGGFWGPSIEARMISHGFNKAVPDNYSPTSYLINTMLPPNNKNRVMDYVATLLIE